MRATPLPWNRRHRPQARSRHPAGRIGLEPPSILPGARQGVTPQALTTQRPRFCPNWSVARPGRLHVPLRFWAIQVEGGNQRKGLHRRLLRSSSTASVRSGRMAKKEAMPMTRSTSSTYGGTRNRAIRPPWASTRRFRPIRVPRPELESQSIRSRSRATASGLTCRGAAGGRDTPGRVTRSGRRVLQVEDQHPILLIGSKRLHGDPSSGDSNPGSRGEAGLGRRKKSRHRDSIIGSRGSTWQRASGRPRPPPGGRGRVVSGRRPVTIWPIRLLGTSDPPVRESA